MSVTPVNPGTVQGVLNSDESSSSTAGNKYSSCP